MSEHWEASDTAAAARAMRFTRHRAALDARCREVGHFPVPMIHRPADVRVENWELVRRVFNRVKILWDQFST